MGRNQKKSSPAPVPASTQISSSKYNNKSKTIQKPVPEPQRKPSKIISENKATPFAKPKIRGPIQPAKINEVKDNLNQLENLINTYEEVEMDKETRIKKLMQFIQSKYSKLMQNKPE